MNKVYLWTNKIDIINMADYSGSELIDYHRVNPEDQANGVASLLWEGLPSKSIDIMFADVAKVLNIPVNELLHAIRKVSAERCGSDYTGYWED